MRRARRARPSPPRPGAGRARPAPPAPRPRKALPRKRSRGAPEAEPGRSGPERGPVAAAVGGAAVPRPDAGPPSRPSQAARPGAQRGAHGPGGCRSSPPSPAPSCGCPAGSAVAASQWSPRAPEQPLVRAPPAGAGPGRAAPRGRTCSPSPRARSSVGPGCGHGGLRAGMFLGGEGRARRGSAALLWGWGGSGGGRAECEFRNKRRGDRCVCGVAVLEAGPAARPPPRCSACPMVVSHLVSPVRPRTSSGPAPSVSRLRDRGVCSSTEQSRGAWEVRALRHGELCGVGGLGHAD